MSPASGKGREPLRPTGRGAHPPRPRNGRSPGAVTSAAGSQAARAVARARAELAGLRTDRATPDLVEDVRVDSGGKMVPLRSVALCGVSGPRSVVVRPHDRSAVAPIERALLSANLGLGLQRDAEVIRLTFPQLSTERREQLVRLARARAEDARVALRNVRRDARGELQRLERQGDVTARARHGAEKRLDEITAAGIDEVNRFLAAKEADLDGT